MGTLREAVKLEHREAENLPKYEARPMTVGSSRVEGRHINMEELLLSPEQRQLKHN